MSLLSNLLYKFFYENKMIIITIILLSFIINIIQITVLSYISASIIKSIEQNNRNTVFNNYKYFVGISLLYIIIYNTYEYLENSIMIKFKGWFKSMIIKEIFLINDNNYTDINFTNLNSSIHRCTYIFYNVFKNFISFLLPNITFLIIIFLYFFIVNYNFGIIFLIGNLVIIFYLYFNWNRMAKLHKNYEKSQIASDNILLDFLNNFEKIIYRNESENEINNFNKNIDENINTGQQFFNSIVKNIFIINCIIFVLILTLLYYLINIFYLKKIDITIFITFLTILLLYRDRILINLHQISDYIEYLGRENIIFKYFQDNEFKKIYNDKVFNLEFNNIKFKNIYFSNNNTEVFNNLNIELDINDTIIGITGLSGNGKTTFVKLLIKMYKYKGDILIDNININNIDNKYIRKNIIYISQNSKLFDKTIYDNIFYGCKDEVSNHYISEIFKFKKIKELFENINLNKVVGLNGEKLSGGQRQIINLINGLIIPSKIVIIDEPTNALDIELKKDVIKMLKYFKKYKKCIIIISHDSDVSPIYNHIIKL